MLWDGSFIKTLNDGGSGSFWVGEHTKMLRGWHIWRGHGSFVPLNPTPVPCLTALFHLADRDLHPF